MQCLRRWYRVIAGPTPKTRVGSCQPVGSEGGPSTACTPPGWAGLSP